MEKPRGFEFWSGWGLVSRLMFGVGIAVVAGGVMQSMLLVAEGAEAATARLKRELQETLAYIAPLVADQALTGDYAAIEQILKQQVTKAEVERLDWTDKDGRNISMYDQPAKLTAPAWFNLLTGVQVDRDSVEVTAGGVSYGRLTGLMTPIRAQNRLWEQFVRQLQIVVATLFLMLQFIWLIFRGNLRTLRNLADGADRFSQGDHSVRIAPQGAPEVRQAAEAFNNMATSTENVFNSLRMSESKNRLLATIVEQSSEAIWTRDLNGAVISWNSGAAAMLGYAPAEVMGKALPIGDGDAEEARLRQERLAAGERFSHHARALTKSGGEIDLQIALAPLVNEANEVVGSIAVARDVTQSMRSEEALRQAREAAEAANQAKSSFLARMSHEIRTPMNGVLGMTELLLESGLTSIQRKYAETVQRSGTNLLGIINDVLDFSKIEAGKLELETVEMDLRRVMEDTVDLLAERAHVKGLELACSVQGDLVEGVLGDPLRLGQVLTNLAGNAIKFTETGAVLLSVACVEDSGSHVRMRFEVKDTGAGISEEAQARIFDEFSQADGSTTRKHGGSGLGLAISRQLVEMMGGSLQVESKLGSGSTFWFTCQFEKSNTAAKDATHADPQGALHGVRTLVVESSAISRGILRSQIMNWGMAHRVAETPEHAIELLVQATARGAPFEMALIDLGLPGSAMLELARAIRGHPGIAKLHLVMLAPVGSHDLAGKAREAGLDACLVKPVRQSALYECLVSTVTGRSELNEAVATIGSHQHRTDGEHHGNILLVEDNLINQAVALGMLNKLHGYNVAVAANGLEALQAHARHPFDLILMDCHMPEMDGYEATRRIRATEAAGGTPHVPIVALTANAMAQDREDCLNAGMDDHLSKPFSRSKLADMLNKWMPEGKAPPSLAPVAAPTNGGGPLDHAVLRQLSELQDADDPDLLARVVNLYVAESPKLVDKMRLAWAAADPLEMARAAHSLKSSSANIGAAGLAALCGQLQEAGQAGRLEEARALLSQIDAEHPRVLDALRAELTSSS